MIMGDTVWMLKWVINTITIVLILRKLIIVIIKEIVDNL